MKTHFILEKVEAIDFSVLAINSHAKGYKLCWNINKEQQLNFEKVEDQIVENEMMFSRYFCETTRGDEYNILVNRSKKGYLIPNQKSVNFFLIVKNRNWLSEKREFISKLRENKEVLLVFELDTVNSKYTNRFIFNDKKN
tara:strand:+ start:949 stop:1368 length:420 start_codon:yes stop_codon:yes gene_type:complete